jgi:hypothetical protein
LVLYAEEEVTRLPMKQAKPGHTHVLAMMAIFNDSVHRMWFQPAHRTVAVHGCTT